MLCPVSSASPGHHFVLFNSLKRSSLPSLAPGVTGTGEGWDPDLKSGSSHPPQAAELVPCWGSRCWQQRHLCSHSSVPTGFGPDLLCWLKLSPQSPQLCSPIFWRVKRGCLSRNARIHGDLPPLSHKSRGHFAFRNPWVGWVAQRVEGTLLSSTTRCVLSPGCRSGRVQPVPKALQLHLQEHRGQLPVLLPPGLRPAGGRQDLQRFGATRRSRGLLGQPQRGEKSADG